MMMKPRLFLLVLCALVFLSCPTWATGTLQAVRLSETDREAIARVTYAEAGNQGDTGLAGVVFTILNRLLSGQFGSSITEILNAKNQFEPVTRAGGWKNLPALAPADRARIDTIINLALDGRLPDPTNGSLFFQNPATVAQREAAGNVSKGLTRFNGSRPAAVIRDHEFYVNINGSKVPAPVLLESEKQPEPMPWDIYSRARQQDLQVRASWDVFAQTETETVR